jgi:hypothetical protein
LGYRAGHDRSHAIALIQITRLRAKNLGVSTLCTFFDLRFLFDKVNRSELLFELQASDVDHDLAACTLALIEKVLYKLAINEHSRCLLTRLGLTQGGWSPHTLLKLP